MLRKEVVTYFDTYREFWHLIRVFLDFELQQLRSAWLYWPSSIKHKISLPSNG